ncbi:MAG: DEAD/DEAH box helicase [Dehalococcoidales bacterium]|nr:MAG: DEAD/DEAH box helicase [Dehalococcoidales bacterium]
MSVLSRFHPNISQWFLKRIGRPTEVQEESWQRISDNEHVLITAPTGSGKTLAAFLWAINQLATGQFPTGHTSILYVSPLKALNNDVQRNLLDPLKELRETFRKSGKDFPEINVLTRSGDTPQAERHRMQRHPPEILITTPESLNLMLSSKGGRSILAGLQTIILDEVHGVFGNKRGVHLMTAIERLTLLSGEFQRISLSATIRPLETVAAFVGGYRIEGNEHSPVYTPRSVSIVHSETTKEYDISVRSPEKTEEQDSVWDALTMSFREIIRRNDSTLFFANNRRLCERLALRLNDGEESPVAYVHHGSLSREVRTEVERKLREGELRAVVATNSLELGIDIGSLNEVILVQSPHSVSSAIQRVGRAGHQVGEICRGELFPTHSQDLLEAAVLATAITKHDMESTQPVLCPLDVLAQIIISMTGVEKWDIDRLYTQIVASYPYRHLKREQFDLVLNMLAGRYVEARVRDLKQRISIDRLDNSVEAVKGALLALYTSGGMIPDRGYFHLRHQETVSLIGELDEEFVWEATTGQTFALGTQNWKIERVTHNDVFVTPGNPRIMAAPFWIGEENYRDFHFSEHIGRFLEMANDSMQEADFLDTLKKNYHMDTGAAEQLFDFLDFQKEMTGCDLPHRHHILVEYVSTGPGGVPGNQMILHTTWGGRVNRPFAMALEAAWEESYSQRLEVYTGNDCIVIQLPHDAEADEVLSLVTSANVEKLLRKRLEGSGFFGARFRECAGRSLLLTRNKIGQRMPLWMNRMRSQKLLASVMQYEDFPILLEAWRTCLQDEFDMEGLKQVLTELETGVIRWSVTHTGYPSPMAQSSSWRQINDYLYRTDELKTESTTSRLRSDLLNHVVFTPGIRPPVDQELVKQFELKQQRLSPGYSPETPRELVGWIKERLLIPAAEWERLLRAMKTDHKTDIKKLRESLEERLALIKPPAASEPLVVALEILPRIIRAFYGEQDIAIESLTDSHGIPFDREDIYSDEGEDSDEIMADVLEEWLRYHGPVTYDFIHTTLGIEKERLSLVLEDIIDSQKVIMGTLVKDSIDEYICDSENYEILLRLARASAVPVFEPLDIEWLPLCLAQHQGLTDTGDELVFFIEELFRRIEQLLCLPLPASLWESEVLPARLRQYSASWLDSAVGESNLRWVGSEKQRITFCFESDMELLQEDIPGEGDTEESIDDDAELTDIFPSTLGKYDFSTLLTQSGYRPGVLSDRLWDAVWQGKVTNDTITALRRGILNRFKPPEIETPATGRRFRSRRTSGGRRGFTRWKNTLPYAGSWFLLPQVEPDEDLLETEERTKDRVRLLLDRYGILFRELLERESPAFQWRNVFRALRLMELSGEVLAGYFFHGIPGLQFISHQAFRRLQRKPPEDAVYWVNAVDPASLCGIKLESMRGSLPKRVASTHLVYRGTRLVAVSRRNGRDLTFNVDPDDPHLPEYLVHLRHMLTRQFQPLQGITIDTINDEKATRSPYLDVLRTAFDVQRDYKNVRLYRKSR